jgi:hypothetical protein
MDLKSNYLLYLKELGVVKNEGGGFSLSVFFSFFFFSFHFLIIFLILLLIYLYKLFRFIFYKVITVSNKHFDI